MPVEQATTPSLGALRAYTLAVAERARGDEIDSIPFLLRATELDPSFALAHMMLSTVYGNLGETRRSEEHATRAFEHRGKVSERERLGITYQYHDRVTGEKDRVLQTLNVLRQLYPRDFSPANNLAVVQNQLGRYEQAVEAAREANRRNPSHPFPYSNLAYAYRGLNRYDDAVRTADQAVARSIASGPTRRLLYQIALLRGDTAASQRHREWATGPPANSIWLAPAHRHSPTAVGCATPATSTPRRWTWRDSATSRRWPPATGRNTP